jgi:D-glycero-alpha-D-manno-heptose-7-phosphate kinase
MSERGDAVKNRSAEQVLITRDRRNVNRETIIRARSPLRISFVGGGTDMPHYYEENGGAVLSSTINRYSHVYLYPREDLEVRIRSLDMGSNVKYAIDQEPIYDGVLDLAKAAIRRMGSERGFELDVHTEAPPGSGLGGSSAVTSAILGAVRELTGVVVDSYELAELNYRVERIDLGIAGGKQDQYATVFGGFNVIEFFHDRVLVTPLRLSRELLNELECHLMLCYTGKVRPSLGLVDAQVKYYQEKRPSTLASMKRLHEMVYEMKETLLKGQLQRFGELLDESLATKKLMNPNITDPHIDGLYALAKANGAIGGKLLGAGGGGYLLLFVQGHRRHDVREALEHSGGQFTSFSFDEYGLQTWRSTCR